MSGPAAPLDLRVPDGIDPITGYRIFRVESASGPDPVLASMTTRGFSWAPAGVTEASCPGGSEHVPGPGCSCGLYALNTLEDLLFEFGPCVLAERDSLVARVQLWGRVVVGSRGVRAERGRVAALLPGISQVESAFAVARRYRVQVSSEGLDVEVPPGCGRLVPPARSRHLPGGLVRVTGWRFVQADGAAASREEWTLAQVTVTYRRRGRWLEVASVSTGGGREAPPHGGPPCGRHRVPGR